MTRLLRLRRASPCASIFALVLVLLAPHPLQARSYKVLHTFSSDDNGYSPQSDVVLDSHGNIYGTTIQGGTGCNGYGCGVVFKVGRKGTYTVLHRFTGPPDGESPGPGHPVLDGAGDLFVATGVGGTGACNSGAGCGAIFRINASGKETIFYSFAGGQAGQGPNSGLVADSAGNLYGTTELGGDPTCNNGSGYGCGVVFKVDSAGIETVLYAFHGLPDAQNPQVGLALDSTGTLYGTAGGGAFGFGAVYKVDSVTGQETVLYSFTDGADGNTPGIAAPVVDSSGSVYGVTWRPSTAPRVFKVDSKGNETTLHTFHGYWYLEASLVVGSRGNLYGTSAGGGGRGDGSVFKLAPNGKLTILHSFNGSAGGGADSSVALDGAGNLHGTTRSGGAHNVGVVYKLTP
jgi:uncharacterized repeat protein (TIGR03803 family)